MIRNNLDYLTAAGRALVLKRNEGDPSAGGVIHLDALGVHCDGNGNFHFIGYWRGNMVFQTRQFDLHTGDVAKISDIRVEVDVTLPDDPEKASA